MAGLRHEPDRHPAARHVQRHERDRAPRRSATIRAGRCRDQSPSRRPEDGEAMGRVLRCRLAEQALPALRIVGDMRQHGESGQALREELRQLQDVVPDACQTRPRRDDG